IEARAADWGQSVAGPARVTVVRVHHWGSRWFSDRNRALWSGFVVHLAGGNLFFAGDTGLGDGKWPGEAAALGPIRLAIPPLAAPAPLDLSRLDACAQSEAVQALP